MLLDGFRYPEEYTPDKYEWPFRSNYEYRSPLGPVSVWDEASQGYIEMEIDGVGGLKYMIYTLESTFREIMPSTASFFLTGSLAHYLIHGEGTITDIDIMLLGASETDMERFLQEIAQSYCYLHDQDYGDIFLHSRHSCTRRNVLHYRLFHLFAAYKIPISLEVHESPLVRGPFLSLPEQQTVRIFDAQMTPEIGDQSLSFPDLRALFETAPHNISAVFFKWLQVNLRAERYDMIDMFSESIETVGKELAKYKLKYESEYYKLKYELKYLEKAILAQLLQMHSVLQRPNDRDPRKELEYLQKTLKLVGIEELLGGDMWMKMWGEVDGVQTPQFTQEKVPAVRMV